MSILGQLEKCGILSKTQKRDEYLRFCNMLNRILVIENLSESIKLIQIDDEEVQGIGQPDQDETYGTGHGMCIIFYFHLRNRPNVPL